MGTIWPIVRLIWSPRHLAAASLVVPTWAALVSGAIAAGIGGGAVLWAVLLPFAEPYADLADALALRGIPAPMILAACVAWAVGIIVWTALGLTAKTARDIAILRAMLLSPIALSLPLALWAPCLALVLLSAPSVQLAAGTPGWMHSTAVQIVGSPLWLILAFAAYCSLLWHTSCGLDDLFSRAAKICPGCSYDLSGLDPAAPCPECGRPRGAP